MSGIAGIQSELLPPTPGTGEKPRERYIVTRDQLSQIFGVNPKTLNRFVTEGMPKQQHGKYELCECWQWREQSLLQRLNDRAPMTSSERERYDKARADAAELNLAERRRELIPLSQVQRVATSMAAAFVSGLEALPARLAPELAPLSLPGQIQAKLTEAVNDIRTDIGAAIGDLGSVPARKRASKPTTKKKRRPVGGRKKAPA